MSGRGRNSRGSTAPEWNMVLRPVHGPARHRCRVVEHQGHAGGRGHRRRGRIGRRRRGRSSPVTGGRRRRSTRCSTSCGRVLGRLGDDRLGGSWGWGSRGVAESGAPVAADGTALAPVIAWHDRRGEAVAERLTAAFGDELDRSIGQRLRYVSTVAKLGWLVEQGLAADGAGRVAVAGRARAGAAGADRGRGHRVVPRRPYRVLRHRPAGVAARRGPGGRGSRSMSSRR